MQSDLFAPAPRPVIRGKWPTEQLHDLLTGLIAWNDASPAIQSWAVFYIHEAAVEILALPDKEKRRAALNSLPAHIRPRVEMEARRLFA